MKRLWAWATTLAFGLVPSSSVHAEDLAYVRSASSHAQEARGDQGSAWLFHRGGVCYAATPRHLLVGDEASHHDDRYARVVVVRPGRVPIEAQADRCAVFKDYDLALMRVTGIADLAECGNVLIGQGSIDPVLGAATQASLLTATESGSFVRSALGLRSARVNDPDHFWVAPAAARDRLTQGMSGSHVTIQDRLAGFLLAISNESLTEGMAKVLRSDRVSLFMTRLFSDPSLARVDDAACLHPIADGPATTASSRVVAAGGAAPVNRADQSCGASVSAWSSPPMSPTFRPDNLVGVGGASGRWRALAGEEMTVDVRLCGTGTSAMSRLRFETSGCQPGDNVASDVEVIVLGPSGAPITSLGYARIPTSGSVEVGGGGPVRGTHIRLRFVGRSEGRDAVCAGRLLVD